MSTQSLSFHSLLFDARFWRERLGAADRVPRQLLVFPQHEAAVPGAEASEFWLRAHDGARLRAWFGRSLLAPPRPELLLTELAPEERGRLDWDAVADGHVHVLHASPVGRRLEDRVLDLLRVARAAADLGELEDRPLGLRRHGGSDGGDDALWIAERLVEEGWI